MIWYNKNKQQRNGKLKNNKLIAMLALTGAALVRGGFTGAAFGGGADFSGIICFGVLWVRRYEGQNSQQKVSCDPIKEAGDRLKSQKDQINKNKNLLRRRKERYRRISSGC